MNKNSLRQGSNLSKVITVRINFEINTSEAEQKLTKTWLQAITVQQILMRTMSLVRRMGLPEDLERGAVFLTRFMGIVNQVRLAVIALNAALAGTPGGWILLSLAAVGLIMDVGDMMTAS